MALHTLQPSQTVDVLIVGAGLSGIGVACYLKTHHPERRVQILEARHELGGTWSLFKYPGIRSDSDLYTFGYEFKPWKHEKAIADASLILDYLKETAQENGIDGLIQYGQKVVSANWVSAQAHWLVTVENVETGAQRELSCRWLFCAGGYYRYDQGHTPELPGLQDFQGKVVHPQHWPEGLDYSGQQVVVIGSGATAVTLVPAMAAKAAHITMLQRTPSYVMSLPSRDPIAQFLRRWFSEEKAYDLIRRKNIALARGIWRFCMRFPQTARGLILRLTRRRLPEGYAVDQHFNPPYNPWEQRLCLVPDSDLFKAIRRGQASIVTDHIERFTAKGIQLKSGQHLPADLVITATGLNVRLLGGMSLQRDGQPIVLNETVAYKGFMLSGVPNFSLAVGYTNASWTLKIGLVCEHFCRLLAHMDQSGHAVCEVVAPADLPTRPLLDFKAGYVQRVLDQLPRQGPSAPWLMSMDYYQDLEMLRKGPVVHEALRFQAAPGVDAAGSDSAQRPALKIVGEGR